MLKKITRFVLFFPLFLAACAPAGPKSYPEGSIAAYLAADGRFSTFLEITDEVVHESAPPLLTDPERSITIFAPTDQAFAKLEPELQDRLKGDAGLAQELLFHHGFDKPLLSKDFGLLAVWPTIITPVKVSFEFEGDQIRYDGALVIETDIQIGGSVVHVLDEVAGY